MADWTYLLADLRSNAIMGEVPLTGVSLTKTLGAAGNASATLPVSPKIKGDPYTLTTPARTALYALRDGRPWWGGIIWTRAYDSEANEVSLGCADWWTYYDHRRVIPVLSGGENYAALSVSYNQADQNHIARSLVALAQSHTGGSIGVTADLTNSGVLRDRTYLGYELVDVGEAIKQLSEVEGGPDVMFDVAADLDNSGRPKRIMRIGTPDLGVVGSPHVWEYGGNLLSYRWPSDGTRMATRSWAVGDGIEAGQLIAMVEDTTKYATGWPLLEQENAYNTVINPETLLGHAVADQAVARLPVVLPELTVRGDRSPTIGEVSPGDDARVIIQDDFIRTGIDTRMRVVSITVAPSDDAETATMTMSPLTEDVA